VKTLPESGEFFVGSLYHGIMIVGGVMAGLAAAILFFDAFVGRVEKEEPIRMIGLSLRTGLKTIFRGTAKPGQEDKKVKERTPA
jgi:hypothetical protein